MYSEHGLHPIYASDEYSVSTEKEWALDITEESNPCLYFYKLK